MATLLVHILAGSLGIVSGFVALYSAKGAPLHRKAGMVFVYVMLTMCLTGTVIAAVRNRAPAVNIPAGLLTAYLVVTGLTTVRPPRVGARSLSIGAMLVALGVGLANLRFAFEAIANGGSRNGIPAFPFLLFGVVGLIASAQDLQWIRSGGVQGASRLARHLWRMCFALLIATMSFFIGQADVFPPLLRIPQVLALPILAVFLTMSYWLWRVRSRRSFRGMAVVDAPEAA